MGQLEKYGLYVLCLVICLILGVAIWGGDPGSSTINRTELESTAAEVNARRQAQPARGDTESPFAPGRQQTPPKDDIDLKPAEEPTTQPPVDAGGQSPKPAVPEAPATYVVRRGETAEEIASQQLGDRNRAKELLALNGIKDPNRDLRENMTIKLPPRQAPARGDAVAKGAAKDKEGGARGGEARPGVYRVQDGDNPHKIAAAVLKKPLKDGEVARFAEELVRLNSITDETKLKIGTELRLPQVRKN